MEPWFFREPDRLRQERAGIEELRRSAAWLVGAEWRLESELCLDAVIRAHDHDYEVRVSFPSFYPNAPAVVRPRNAEQRLSLHQYGGAGGPLCLEWGPDNWQRDVTAVQMLESAYRLCEIENPLGVNRPDMPIVAPSRHQLTVGQEVRGKWARWYSSEELRRVFADQAKLAVGGFKFSLRDLEENWIVLIHEATPLGGEVWRDAQIPTRLPEALPRDLWTGVWFKTDLEATAIRGAENLEALRSALAELSASEYLSTDGSSPIVEFERPIRGVLVVDRTGDSHLFVVLSSGTAIKCAAIRSEPSIIASRSPKRSDLAGKSVGIVGLGSAGSKIALSLARMGARKLYLVDHDLLLPENLMRNGLDWQGVGEHKVDATAFALRQIAADMEVKVSRTHLTGQESNASISGVLERLGDHDLIIDATANPKAFNLLAAVAPTVDRPIVWLEIFGGGIGGFVARSRPSLDPSPQDMRAIYLQASHAIVAGSPRLHGGRCRRRSANSIGRRCRDHCASRCAACIGYAAVGE